MLSKNKNTKKRTLAYELLLIPALLIYLVFFIYPTLSSFFYSLTDWNTFSREIHFIGMENFTNVFKDKGIIIGIKNSFRYAILFALFGNIFAVIFALALDQRIKSKNLLRAFIFAPAVLSPLVVGFLWSYIMSPSDFGMLNMVLGLFGISPINWLGDSKLALYSVLITQVWQWTGWYMVIYIANLQGMPKELYEAASLDGAGQWQQFRNVTLPNLFPSVTINMFMSLISGLRVYDVVYSLTGGGPGHATETIVTVLLTRAFNDGRYGYASALSVVFFIMVLVITVVLLKVFGKWEESVV